MTTISINCGHTKSGAGYGASYNGFKESEITRAVGYELIKLLKNKGYKVNNSTVDSASSQNEYLSKAVTIANKSKADLFISIHCNASSSHSGYGVECFTWKGTKLDDAVAICETLAAEGFRNRGVKDGSGLYVIRKTTMQAILVELFFLDNDKDRSIYKRIGAKGIAAAIAKVL